MKPETKALVLSNFKYGLDTRRSELSSQPGVLLTAQDGHINAGGQFEKRKAFVRDNVSFPSITFGLQDTDQGLITFGGIPTTVNVKTRSRGSNIAVLTLDSGHVNLYVHTGDTVVISGLTNAVSGNYNGTYVVTHVTPTQIQYANVGTNEGGVSDTAGRVVWTPILPTGVSYQYLAPPNGYNATVDILLTAIPFSCNYRGKAFVLAQFTNSPIFAFYDGELVKPTRNGIVLTIETGVETSTNLSSDLTSQINDIDGWVGVANSIPTYVAGVITKPDLSGLHLLTLIGSTLLYSPPGIHLTPVPDWVSTLGIVRAKLLDQDFGGSAGVASSASFTIVFGTAGTVEVTAPANADGTGSVNLTGGPVNFTSQMTVAIANAINNNTFATGYIAQHSSNLVVVIAPLSFGVVTFNLTVVTTGDITTGPAPTGTLPGVDFILSTSNVKMKATSTSGGSGGSVGDPLDRHHLTSLNVTGSVTASIFFAANGGTGLTFLWEAISNPSNIKMTPDIAPAYSSAATCSFSKTVGTTDSVSGTFKCTVKDAANFTTSQTFTVSYP